MSLRDDLAALQRLDQLPALARELGLEPTWRELSLDALSGGGRTESAGSAVLVGRRDNFLGIGIESRAAGPLVRRVIHSMAARGGIALVLGLDADHGTLTVGVAAGDCPTLAIDLERPSPLDLRKLERGAEGAGSGLARAMRWAEALSTEGVSTRFFHQFRRTLDRTIEALPHRIPAPDRHALGLLQLTRVLFLYFVQDQGWLDGRARFLREELDRRLAGRGRIHRRLLVPLFFGTLNRPPERRRRLARELGRIPFLNGGLFEPHGLERRWPCELPDDVWRDAFDQLFERYHFTVSGAVGGAAIGPDMLGRVFEGVMDPGERRESGAFYTPSRLVGRIVAAAFRVWAEGAAVDLESAAGLERARRIAVLDPAVGSGAFLLGALERLVLLRTAAGEPRGPATREVATTNLFGVDRNPNAVRLAELRLWLEIIGAESAAGTERLDPLPNLDAFVRQGDSLIEPWRAPAGPPAGLAATIGSCRRTLALATGGAKREIAARLRQAELTAGREGIDAAVAALEPRIRELIDWGRAPGLFGDRTGLTRAERADLARLRAERARLRRIARRLRDHDELPWFQYGAHFADVMSRGGFDLVIGNPPWIRAESIDRADRERLKARYRWFRAGRSAGRGYGHQPDLSVAFLERSLELSAPGGTVALLLPSKLVTAQYGAVARAGLVRETTIAVAADLTDRAGADFDATVYPLALVLRRSPPPAGHRVAAALDGPPACRQSSLGAEPWSLDPAAAPLERAAARHPTIGARFMIHLGVKTGADSIFLAPPPACPPELVRPAIRGRDVAPFRVNPAKALLWTHDEAGRALGALPASIRHHLARHESRLRRRADYREGPFWQLFRTRAAAARHRVVWSDLARRLEAVALDGALEHAIPLNTCYLLPAPDHPTALRLAAWLNSSPIRALARARAPAAASGFARFNASTVGALPLPDAVLADDRLAALAELAAGGADVQTELDDRADRLLGSEPIAR